MGTKLFLQTFTLQINMTELISKLFGDFGLDFITIWSWAINNMKEFSESNMLQDHIVPLEPELAMSTPTYDPFGTETTYKSKLFLCQMGHKQNGQNRFWLKGDDI